MVAEVRVQSVAHLVGQRGDAFEVVRVIEQHVGVKIVRPAGGVGPRALTRRRMPINPA